MLIYFRIFYPTIVTPVGNSDVPTDCISDAVPPLNTVNYILSQFVTCELFAFLVNVMMNLSLIYGICS